jgi:hypothetical protein
MTAATVAVKGWFFGRRREVSAATDPFMPSFWNGRRKNPELSKALSMVRAYIAEARDLLNIEDEHAPLRTPEARQRVDALLTSKPKSISIDSAWELANQLKRQLLVLGDSSYVWVQLEYEAERDKRSDKWHRWSDHLSAEKLQRLLAERTGKTVDRSVQLDAVRSLQKLYDLRAEAGLERRARAAQKCRYLTALIPILLVLLAALSATIYQIGQGDIWKDIGLATSAGALGATLSGIFRVRDRLTELDDLRSFWPAMRIQPLVGATAGVFTLLILESGAIRLGSAAGAPWAATGLLTFIAGFSEPFFLGLVQRIAVVPDKDATLTRTRDAYQIATAN